MKNDEYQFPKDEYLEHSDLPDNNTQPPSGGDRRFALLRNRKFVIGFLIFVVIIIGLKLMHHSTPPAAPVAPAPQPVLTAAPASFPVPTQSMATSSELSDTQNKLSALHDQLNSVVATNAQLTQSMAALTTQVTTLAAAVQDTSQKLDALTMKPGLMKKPRYQPAPVIYVIKALVPGRAWLVGSNGVSVNVAVGNYLSGYYGSIQSINASTGQVMTTRGKMITYGSNDS